MREGYQGAEPARAAASPPGLVVNVLASDGKLQDVALIQPSSVNCVIN
jgi:hypothetical protein